MSSYNKVILMGNLTRNPELRFTPGGTPVVDIGLAVNEKWRNKEGEIVEEVCFVDVTVWGKTAENVAQYLTKGSGVLVEGKLKLDQWEKDGEKRQKLTVTAEKVVFTGKAPGKPAPSDAEAPAERGDDDDIPF